MYCTVLTEDDETPSSRRDSVDSTHSEREFRRKYQAITHRMVHRKSSLEMYKRLASKSFGKTSPVVLNIIVLLFPVSTLFFD